MIPDDRRPPAGSPNPWTGQVRALGLCLCLGGLGIAGATVGLTVSEVRNGADRVMDPAKPVGAGLIMLVFGLNLAILGERAKDLLVMHRIDLRQIRPWMWGVFLTSIAVGLTAFVLIRQGMQSLGYTPHPAGRRAGS